MIGSSARSGKTDGIATIKSEIKSEMQWTSFISLRTSRT
jgi:hypothetical protein